MEEKLGLYILSIVAIVAVVSLVILVGGHRTASSSTLSTGDNNSVSDVIGNALGKCPDCCSKCIDYCDSRYDAYEHRMSDCRGFCADRYGIDCVMTSAN